MRSIKEPDKNDVLLGRGAVFRSHPGNQNYLALVKRHRKACWTCTKRQRDRIAELVYNEIQSMKPPGRFLKQNPKSKYWRDIGKKEALVKTYRALMSDSPCAADLRKLREAQRKKGYQVDSKNNFKGEKKDNSHEKHDSKDHNKNDKNNDDYALKWRMLLETDQAYDDGKDGSKGGNIGNKSQANNDDTDQIKGLFDSIVNDNDDELNEDRERTSNEGDWYELRKSDQADNDNNGSKDGNIKNDEDEEMNEDAPPGKQPVSDSVDLSDIFTNSPNCEPAPCLVKPSGERSGLNRPPRFQQKMSFTDSHNNHSNVTTPQHPSHQDTIHDIMQSNKPPARLLNQDLSSRTPERLKQSELRPSNLSEPLNQTIEEVSPRESTCETVSLMDVLGTSRSNSPVLSPAGRNNRRDNLIASVGAEAIVAAVERLDGARYGQQIQLMKSAHSRLSESNQSADHNNVTAV